MKEPLVSVIIPTYNSEKTIKQCLESIKNQTYKNIEIIVVDNYSTDNTVAICEQYYAKVFRLKCERTKAKNFGLRKAKGKYVLFLDSDMELTQDIIKECVMLVEKDPSIGGIIIPERSVGNDFWAKVRNYERSFYEKTIVESARFFRRDLALKAGGFDEGIVFFEEATLPNKIERLGYNVRARIDFPILHHEEEFSLFRWLKKKYYYGQTAREYLKRYKDHGVKQISAIRRASIFLLNKRFWHSPHLALGVILLKVLEYLVIKLAMVRGCIAK